MNREQIAMVCHEANRTYCVTLGDFTQPQWADAPEWQKDSARKGVDLHVTEDCGPEASHLSWLADKIQNGWTYGPVKDAELKQHPCMLAFHELPPEQQAKDHLFRGIVHALRGFLNE